MNRIETYKKDNHIGSCIFKREVQSRHGRRRAIFECPLCHGEFESDIQHVKRGNTVSCGCQRGINLGNVRRTHGKTGTRIYRIWSNAKSRCSNQNLKSYNRYGGRGISMCNEWHNDFKAFYDYVTLLSHYGEPDMTLDRIDNDGNYEPGNLRWVDRHVQGINQERFVRKGGPLMGVAKATKQKGYFAYITVNNKFNYLGKSDTDHGAVGLRNNFIIKNGLWEYPVQAIPDFFPLDTLKP